MSSPRPPRPPDWRVGVVLAVLMAATLTGVLVAALLEGRL